MWWAWLACADPAPPCALGLPQLLVATTDFRSGALAVVDAAGERCDAVATVGPDPAARAVDGGVVVFDRTGGTSFRRYRGGDYTAPDVEFAVEPGANPHDAAWFGGEWWLAPYERGEVWRLDAAGKRVGSVSLAEWADADGLPEVDRLVVTGGRLFAALQRLDRGAGWSSDHGVVVELGEDGVLGAWEVGPNPKLYADPTDPESLVALTGVFGARDGALERLDLRDGVVTTALREADLGYDLDGFAGIGSDALVLGVDDDGVSRWGCLDLAGGTWVDGDSDPGWFVDAVAGDDAVYVGVRTGWAAGARDAVLAADPAACALEPLATDLRLDPFSLAWVR